MKKQKEEPSQKDFLNQERSSYNRESGNKTLVLFTILLSFVVILSIATILML